MNSYELLIVFGIPAMFALAGAFAWFIASRETDRFDAKRLRPGD